MKEGAGGRHLKEERGGGGVVCFAPLKFQDKTAEIERICLSHPFPTISTAAEVTKGLDVSCISTWTQD